MALAASSGRRLQLKILISSAITAFSRSSISAEELAAVTSISRYSPLPVSPSPKGAAKDMI